MSDDLFDDLDLGNVDTNEVQKSYDKPKAKPKAKRKPKAKPATAAPKKMKRVPVILPDRFAKDMKIYAVWQDISVKNIVEVGARIVMELGYEEAKAYLERLEGRD